MHFDRFRITFRSPNVYFDLGFSSAFGVDIKISLFVDSDALCDQPSTISATRSGVESRSDFYANRATGYHHFCKRNVDHESTFFLRNVVNFNLYLVSNLRNFLKLNHQAKTLLRNVCIKIYHLLPSSKLFYE